MGGASVNVDVVREIYDAFNRRDIPHAFSFLADDVAMEQSDEIPWGGAYRGIDGAAQFFAKLGRTQGTVNATGARYDVPIAHVWELRDGKAVAVRFYIDNPTMLAALTS